MYEDALLNLFLTVGVAAMPCLVVIGWLVFYRQQRQFSRREYLRSLEARYHRELLDASLRWQEAECRRFAADLHDDVGTMLSATRLCLAQANRYAGDNPAMEAAVRQTRELLEETVNNVRRITKELLPATLDDLGLPTALDEFVSRLRRTVPDVTIDFIHETYDPRLAPPVELALYRVAQELVHNSLHHARPTRIELQLLRQPNRVVLTVCDDGVGFSPEAVRKPGRMGLGLKNIESRLNVIGGRVIFDAAPGKGAYVLVDVPFVS